MEIAEDTDPLVVYDVYSDINRGGVGHSAQQMRKVAFHGPFVRMLDELALNKAFLRIQGREAPDDDTEADREMIRGSWSCAPQAATSCH